MKELELKKPIIAHGETLSVLEFDEPTGKDVRELGYPYQMKLVRPIDFGKWLKTGTHGLQQNPPTKTLRCD